MFQELCDKAGSPLGSTGSVTDSIKSESPSGSVPEDRKGLEAGMFFIMIAHLVKKTWLNAALSGFSDYILIVILFLSLVTLLCHIHAQELV